VGRKHRRKGNGPKRKNFSNSKALCSTRDPEGKKKKLKEKTSKVGKKTEGEKNVISNELRSFERHERVMLRGRKVPQKKSSKGLQCTIGPVLGRNRGQRGWGG